MTVRRAALPALLLAVLLAPAAPAEHAAAYRYIVLGYVTDAALSLRADAVALALTARFDPADHLTERGTRVDFAGRRPIENPNLFAPTLRRFLGQ